MDNWSAVIFPRYGRSCRSSSRRDSSNWSSVWLVRAIASRSVGFSRAERERPKLVISTPTDRYRPSYNRKLGLPIFLTRS
jgi:hypothetical protein